MMMMMMITHFKKISLAGPRISKLKFATVWAVKSSSSRDNKRVKFGIFSRFSEAKDELYNINRVRKVSPNAKCLTKLAEQIFDE